MNEQRKGSGLRVEGSGKRKKARGRPAGSRNVRREIVELSPPTCPSCGRSVTVNLNTVPTRVHNYAGSTAAGDLFDRVEWRHIQCECGQGLSVRTPVRESPDED